jgi:outer membrane protein OmpA-like peptidoglycan-associated protein
MGSSVSYARSPVTLRDDDTQIGRLMSSMSTLSILGGYGIVNRFDLGLAIPVHRVGHGSKFAEAGLPQIQAVSVDESEVALGDVRVVPRVTLLERGTASGMGVAALLPVSLPTGNRDMYGGESLRVEPRLAWDWAPSGALVAANIGYLVRERARVLNTSIDDAFRWGAGVEIPVYKILSGLLEANGAVNTGSNDAPTEGLAGLRMRASGWLAQIAGGTAMVQGLTAPQYRVVAAVGFSQDQTPPAPADADGDGVLDAMDGCPLQAEDLDRFEDEDGCPDLDDDHDQVTNDKDKCPAEAEDRDGNEDEDGCPDLDDDHDLVLDANDRCVGQAEDADGFQDTDGCPDTDNDQDGVLDADDKCPGEAGVAAQQGCPAPAVAEPSQVKVSSTQIELKQTVQFARNKATIEPESMSLMDQVAEVLKAHPEIERVVVEGHSDDLGSRRVNLRVSQGRADAVVQALTERGIARKRLEARGIGPDRPLVPNDSEESRERNRRVELHIEQRAQ